MLVNSGPVSLNFAPYNNEKSCEDDFIIYQSIVIEEGSKITLTTRSILGSRQV